MCWKRYVVCNKAQMCPQSRFEPNTVHYSNPITWSSGPDDHVICSPDARAGHSKYQGYFMGVKAMCQLP